MSRPDLTPKQFVEKWAKNTLNEKAVAQTHFNELCAMLGIPAPNDNPATQHEYRFEQPLSKDGGGAGFADVWHAGKFVWEYKTKGRSLDDAYRQLLLYKGDLGNPPVLVVCDIERYVLRVEYTGTPTRTFAFTNAELENATTRELLRDALTHPERLKPADTTVSITQEAAQKLVQVARLLEQRYPAQQVAHFFMKLLFALFAEDIYLLPDALLSDNLRAAIQQPATIQARLRGLFHAMDTGGIFGASLLPRFNGALFADDLVLDLHADELQLLADAAKLDWSAVEPSIFGTLFERALDPAKRSQLGAHYTSEDDIRLIVEPVLMQPLRREWAQVQARVQGLLASGKQSERTKAQVQLEEFIERLAALRVLDPACGSGNFLYVALKQLKDLEQEIGNFAEGVELPRPQPQVQPTQFAGIEQNPFAAELAQVVLWIGYWQWRRTNGYWDAPEPILQPLTTIVQRDAILHIAEDGTPTAPDWPPADVIIGNPPFLGWYKIRQELGDDYVEALAQVYSGRVSGSADLVCFWFEQARAQLVKGQRVGLLATNSIRGGANRKVLDQIKQTGDIFMAWADRPWIVEGAAVRVSMVGFDDGTEQERTLDGQPVQAINADLTGSADITRANPLKENANLCSIGIMKGGAFDIDAETARRMIAAPNISGLSNQDVIRPVLNATDIVRKPRNMWIIDFGVDMTESNAQKYELPYEHVLKHVKDNRINLRMKHRAEYWWIFNDPSPKLRSITTPLSRFIVTPRVSKYRVFVWVKHPTLPDSATVSFARADDYFFGVLHSRIHEVWALRMGTWLGKGNDPRYTPTTCFETFPFPYPPGHEPPDDPHVAAIGAAAAALHEWREAWLNPPDLPPKELAKRTLTNLYNARPDDLTALHAALDTAVAAAYGWEWPLSDEEILTRLLALNTARAGANHEEHEGREG